MPAQPPPPLSLSNTPLHSVILHSVVLQLRLSRAAATVQHAGCRFAHILFLDCG